MKRTVKIIDRRTGSVYEGKYTTAQIDEMRFFWMFFDELVEVWVTCEDYPDEWFQAH